MSRLSTTLVLCSLAMSASAQAPYYYRRRHHLAGGVIVGIVIGKFSPPTCITRRNIYYIPSDLRRHITVPHDGLHGPAPSTRTGNAARPRGLHPRYTLRWPGTPAGIQCEQRSRTPRRSRGVPGTPCRPAAIPRQGDLRRTTQRRAAPRWVRTPDGAASARPHQRWQCCELSCRIPLIVPLT